MTNLDKILKRIAYWNGYDSAGEWERTGHEAKAQLEQYIANQVREARIDELQHIREFWGQAKDESLSSKPFNFVALSDIDNRIKELQEGKK